MGGAGRATTRWCEARASMLSCLNVTRRRNKYILCLATTPELTIPLQPDARKLVCWNFMVSVQPKKPVGVCSLRHYA